MTGYADDDIKKKAGFTEPHAYLVKPFYIIDIKSSIEMALQET